MPPRNAGRFVSPATAQAAPLLTVRPDASRAAAVIGSLGGKATAAKTRGKVRLVADILNEQLGRPRGPWWRG